MDSGLVVPEFQIDDEFAEAVLARSWSASNGYLRASIDGHAVYLHRFVWSLKHGSCPAMLDHINRDRADNRVENLRPATRSMNNRNVRKRKASGLPVGVSHDTRSPSRPYRASGKVDGRTRHLGYFATPDEAGTAYAEWRDKQLAGA
jgi:hypothetical protein